MTRYVVVSAAALRSIAEVCAAEAGRRETGGILLGRLHADGHLSVEAAGDPGPLAQQAPSRFRRDAAHAQELASAAYQRDRSIWLGDWHTHPTGPAYPSPVDMRSYADVLRDPAFDGGTFLSIIVRPASSGPVLYPWARATAGARPLGLWVDRSR